MSKTKKLKAKFIERFFFWFGVLLVGLSGYLFTSAYLKSDPTELDSTQISFNGINIYSEHEYIHPDSTPLASGATLVSILSPSSTPKHPFGVIQYPKGTWVGGS